MTLHQLNVRQRRATVTANRPLLRKTVALARWFRPVGAESPDCTSIRYSDRSGRGSGPVYRSPVLLVHGYAGTEHIWGPLRTGLTEAGFGCVVALRYNAFRADVEQIADWLAAQARCSMDASGTDSVHLVGHSLGGLVVRDAVLRAGLDGVTRTAVTIATPHAGAPLARFVPGPAARQMRPGSEFLTKLAVLADPADHAGDRAWRTGQAARLTRWITINGVADRVVPQSSSVLSLPSATVMTMRQPAAGHGSVARHPAVVSRIVRELHRAEQQTENALALAA